MKEKATLKRYMLVLQKRVGEQEAVEFDEQLEPTLVPIEIFSDQKISFKAKKDSKVKKNTLAFFDMITNRFKNYDQFLSFCKKDVYPYDYKPNTSYIGIINNKYMNTLKISFNDLTLAEIAKSANGSKINKNDSTTLKIITDIMDMLEDLDCDFAAKLYTMQAEEKKEKYPKYDISNDFISSVKTFREVIRAKEFRNKNGYKINDDLEDDYYSFKSRLISKMESYKVFREIYRFRKDYLLDKLKEQPINTPIPISQTKIDEEKEAFEKFRKEYEEVRQKEYPRNKQKVKTKQIPGQMSLFD